MPRKKADNGGESSGGGSSDSGVKEYNEARAKQDEAVVVGKEKTMEQQLKEVRGDPEDKTKEIAEYTDNAGAEAEKILEEAFPERKATNIRVEANRKFQEKFGIDPNHPGDRPFRVQMAEGMEGEPTYKGRLTLKSVHGETHEDVSFVTVEEVPRGTEYLWYVMRIACPHAMREKFEIDAENVTDPLLRDRYT